MVAKWDQMQVLVLRDFFGQSESPGMLYARLFGLRAACGTWLASGMSSGNCVLFANHLQQSSTFYVSEAFRVQHRHHWMVLQCAHRASKRLYQVEDKARRLR
eukprot:2924752-Lingulodinium_polyedra.AAC.1